MISSIETLMSSLRLKLPEYLQKHGIDNPNKHFRCIEKNHEDKNPSMSLYKDNTYVKCHSCGFSSDIFTAAHHLDGAPLSGEHFITDNLFFLAKMFNIDTSHIILGDITKQSSYAFRYNYLKAYKIVAEYLQDITDKSPTRAFEKEITKRKWAQKTSIKLGIVGCSSFADTMAALQKSNFSNDFLKSIGLLRPDIFNQDNIIFIIYDENSNPIAFYSRDTKYEEKRIEFDKKDFSLEIVKEKPPIKYNSTANCNGIYEKKLFPYGIHDIKHYHKIIAVEGHSCKHNMKLNGYDNVIALGGLDLSKETIERLISFGVTNIALLLDNDISGYKKTKALIKEHYGNINIEFSIIDISEYGDIKDPDELIRKHNIDAIKALTEYNCIEWLAIKELSNNKNVDKYIIAKDIASYIASERSPITRMKLVNNISIILDIPASALNEEIDQKISVNKDRKSEFALKVLDDAKDLIRQNPNALNTAMNLIETRLLDLNKNGNDIELFSTQECLKGLSTLKEREENDNKEPVILTGFSEWDEHSPFPIQECFGLLPAPPSSGKSGFLLTMCNNILRLNPNTMVIMYTNDDSRDIYYERLVAIQSKLSINWINRPNYFLDDEKKEIRNSAYNILSDYILNERLIIKDISHGASVEYFVNLVTFYRNKYPDRNIFVTCDNLHRMSTECDFGDSRLKVKWISSYIKACTIKQRCVCLASVEMNKNNMWEKPYTAESIAETASLQYDANLIIFLWNERNAKREVSPAIFSYQSLEYIKDIGYVIENKVSPLVEALFLKSKISSFKGSIYFKFFDDMALFEQIKYHEAKALIEENKKLIDVKSNKTKRGDEIEH